jgi:hypothetical protein
MPTVRKLNEDEFMQYLRNNGGVRSEIEREYDRYLADFAPGDYGMVALSEEEGTRKQTVRNRLTAAADRRGLVIGFIKTRGNAIRFKIEDGDIENVVFWPTRQTEETASS